MAITYTKDPVDVLDYEFDWATSRLEEGETILTHTVTADTGLTVDSSSEASGVVTAWVSGGTLGQDYSLDCVVTTSGGRTYSRRILIKVVDK